MVPKTNPKGKYGRTLFALLLGAALFGSAPAFAGADVSGAGGAAASAQAAVDAAADASVSPPDLQAHMDAAMGAAMTAAATAEAEARMLLATKDSLEAGGDADWALHGDGEGRYEVGAGGDAEAGAEGTAEGHVEKGVSQEIDVSGAGDVANDLLAQFEAGINGLISLAEEATAQLHGSITVGLDAAATAVGTIGADIGGLFSFHEATQVINSDALDVSKTVDWDLRQDLPSVGLPRADVPNAALDLGGSAAADVTAVAQAALDG